MKKLIIFLCLIIAVFAFGETITIIQGCNVRADHKVSSEILAQVKTGDKFEVLDVYGDYASISSNKFVWTGQLTKTNGKYIVNSPGVTVVNKPCSKSKGSIPTGETIKTGTILNAVLIPTWYRITAGNDIIGWISKDYCK